MSIGPLNEKDEFARRALEMVVFGQCLDQFGNKSLAERISGITSFLVGVDQIAASDPTELQGRLQSIGQYLTEAHFLLSKMNAQNVAFYTGELFDYAVNLKQITTEHAAQMKFMAPKIKQFSALIKNYRTIDSAKKGVIESNIERGLVLRAPSWKQRSLFWKGLSDSMYLSRLALSSMTILPDEVQNAADYVGISARLLFFKDSQQLYNVMTGFRDTASGFYHGLRIVSEVVENTPGVQFPTRKQKASSAAAVLGSLANVTRLGSEAMGFGSLGLNQHLGLVGAFFGVTRFFLGWNSTDPGKELVRVKDELIEAFKEYLREYATETLKNIHDDSELADLLTKTIKTEIDKFMKPLLSECKDTASLNGYLSELDRMTQGESRDMFSPGLTKKCELFIIKARKKLDEQAVLIVQKCDALSDYLKFVQKLQGEAIDKMGAINGIYGEEESSEKRFVQDGILGYISSLTAEIQQANDLLANRPMTDLDISRWLRDVNEITAPAYAQSLREQMAYILEPPSIIDDLHL